MRALMLDGLEDEAMRQLSLCLRPEQGDEVCVLEDSGLVNPPGDFRPGGHRPVPPGPWLATDPVAVAHRPRPSGGAAALFTEGRSPGG
jgi:hypothetical protein